MENMTEEKKPGFEKKLIKLVWGAMPVLFLVLIIVALGFGIKFKVAATQEAKLKALKKEQPPVNVVALELVPSIIRDRMNLPGIIEPWVKLVILSEVRGTVTLKAVEEGKTVKKGEVLAWIDKRDYQNQYNSARASYKAALASLKRLQGLYKEQLATRSQIDDTDARLENAKAAMDNAALALSRCAIKAPISGLINNMFVEKGQYLNTADPVAEILQLEKVKVTVGIPESDVDAVRKLIDFDVKIDALDGRTFKAKKHFISRTADAHARLYRLELALENKNGEILPDMFARVEIVKKELLESLAVPLFSVITRNDEKLVYIVNDSFAHVRKVEIGMLDGWKVQIKSGLKPGERVIVIGHKSVNDGDKVKVIRQVKNPEEIAK